MKTSPLIMIVTVVALLSGLMVRQLIATPLAAETGTTLPEFTLPDLDGKPHSSKDWQGKILVINFWATWCPPCLKEIPEFANLQKEFASQGVQVVGIALDDKEPVKDFLKTHKIAYPVLLGEEQGTQLAHAMGNTVDTVPFTAIVNQEGQIIHQKMGVMHREDMLAVIKHLLNKAK